MDFLQTTLCYLEKDGCYLMLHRVKKKNDANYDKWVGVGGKFEPGEDALACVMREVTEETGLTMQAPAYRGPLASRADAPVHLHPVCRHHDRLQRGHAGMGAQAGRTGSSHLAGR